VVVIACLLLLIGGFRFVWRVGLVESPALGIPKSCWYGAASTGLGLMALHGVGTSSPRCAAAVRCGVDQGPDDELPSASRRRLMILGMLILAMLVLLAVRVPVAFALLLPCLGT
jgi:hypothetical protein